VREAAARRRARAALAAEARALGSHAADREEMRDVRELMAGLAPTRID
jgi:hypothetical protein